MELLTTIDHNQLFIEAFHSAPIGMVIIATNGRILKVNEAGLALIGYTKDELCGLSIHEVTHPEDIQQNMSYLQELLEGDRSSYRIIKRLIHKNGKILWGLLHVSLIKNTSPAPLLIIQVVNLSGEKKYEQQLKESEKYFELLVRHSTDFIASISENGTYCYVSPSSEVLLGYRPDEMIGTKSRFYAHPDEQDNLRQQFKNVLQKKGKVTMTHRARRKEGDFIWFETTVVKIVRDGKAEGYFIFARDVTKHEEGKKRLKEEEERYKSLFMYHPDMVYSLNLKGEFETFNPICEKVTGYSSDEIMSPDKTFHYLVHQKDLYFVEQNFEKAIKGKVRRFECRIYIKNGEIITLDNTFIPIILDEQVVGVYGISQNIEERKQAERQLRATQNQLESFIDHHLDSILIFNSDWRLIRVNNTLERIYGWKAEELLGKPLSELDCIPVEERVNSLRRATQLSNGETVGHVETIRSKKDGTPLETLVSSFSIYDENGLHNGWASVFRDISDQKKAEVMMVNSEKLAIAGELAAGIAHEIRNPLTAIKGFLQFMKMSKDTPPNPEYFDIVGSEIERIEGIVSELLILSKPQKVIYRLADLKVLVKEVVKLLDSQAILNNVEILLNLPLDKYPIYCEANQLKQVFINFIKNGIEAMPEGGRLDIRLSSEEKGYHIQFIDEGIGMSEDLIRKLGQPFYTTKEKGTGLGFMVSKKIIEEHQGDIQIKSELKKGTTIDVILPPNN